MDYESFLREKIPAAAKNGLDISSKDIHPILKPHQRAIVQWAVRGGRRGIFAAFGLGKTMIQLEILKLILRAHGGAGLIVLPLGVRQEFIRDAAMVDLVPKFIRSPAEIEPGRIHLTNYETVRDGKLDPALFTVASLDEASALRGFGGTKTFREFMRLFAPVRFRFVATATPSPNEYIEILSYSAFLGIMDVGQAKTRFFRRNSEQADKLTLHPHKEREFWLWVASWGLFVQKPSDLGFSDEGYELPPLEVHWHEIGSDHSQAGADRQGQRLIFVDPAIGVTAAASEKRNSLPKRIERMVAIVREQRMVSSVLSGTQNAISATGTNLLSEKQGTNPGTRTGLEESQSRKNETAPENIPREEQGQDQSTVAGMVPEQQDRGGGKEQDKETGALWPDARGVPGHHRHAARGMRDLWTEFPHSEDGRGPLSRDGRSEGYSLPTVQRGTGPVLRRSGDAPGRGTLSDQLIIWCDLNDEQRAIEKALGAEGLTYSSLYGRTDLEVRECLIEAWRARETDVFLSKPVMYGAGVNLQQCHTMIFVGVGYKFADWVQGIHRIYRFLQEHKCTVHVIYTEAESAIRRALEGKWERHKEQAAIMAKIIQQYGLAESALIRALRRSIGIERLEERGKLWRAINNDAVLETRTIANNIAGFILTSIPFATQYEYTPSYNDFGHTDNNSHFWKQMDYLTPELLRVLQPGRVCAIHIKDRIIPGGLRGLGFQTVAPFHAEAIFHFQKHGFAFLGMKTIVTDVVRENNQTYRLGWTEQCKDGSRMGVGMPEYLLLFRKPPSDPSNGYADLPVLKEKPLCDDHGTPAPFDSRRNWKKPIPGTGYSRARWQMDAHGFSRSSGNRLLSSDELAGLPHEAMYKLWRDRSLNRVYDFEQHVAVAENLDHIERLPATFMLFPPHSWHPDVWTDVARMRTLNSSQAAAGRQMHLCPLQFDIADRAIIQFSMPEETVFDPFAGIMTVPYCAVRLGRRGIGVELNTGYFVDGVIYLRAAEEELSVPTLFDLDGVYA